jgi:DeoR/GlpR family transcriptional regulator of sugar metabolism
MLKPLRHRTILDHISHYGTATIGDLAELIGCSAVTLRKDLRELHELGLLRRTRGGALAFDGSPLYEPPNVERLGQLADEKRAIARHAVHTLVDDDDVIFLDSGTTTLEIAKEIARRRPRLTVVTNSILVTSALFTVPSIHLLVTGGDHRERVASLVGDWLEYALSTVRIGTLFLGANAVDATSGITTPNLLEAEAKRAMIEASGRVVLVADHSKLGRTSFAAVAPLSAVDILLTDANAPKPNLEAFQQHDGLVVELAQVDSPKARTDGDVPGRKSPGTLP